VLTHFYNVAGHRFSVTAEGDDFLLMANYQPFETAAVSQLLTVLTIVEGESVGYTEEIRQEEEGQKIICGRTAEGRSVFEFCWDEETAGWLTCAADYREARLIVAPGPLRKMAIDNAVMVLYALASANEYTVLFHAAVVSYQGCGYMFLGRSGTGKSTHASLWIKYLEGAVLVNDDNPVVRIAEGQATVYGSPWSGKTPCYRNVSCPVGGIVQLSQAPYNRIVPLKGISAYASLVPSISGKRWDERIADGLHQTEDALASGVPMWHLECLPDEDAARLCRNTIAR